MRVKFQHMDGRDPITGTLLSFDGRNYVTILLDGYERGKLVVPVVDVKKITEEGEELPLTKKDLIRFRGECG